MIDKLVSNFMAISGATYADISAHTNLSRSQLHKVLHGQTFWTDERVDSFLKMFHSYGYNKSEVFKKLATVSNILYIKDKYYFDEETFRGILDEINNIIDISKE